MSDHTHVSEPCPQCGFPRCEVCHQEFPTRGVMDFNCSCSAPDPRKLTLKCSICELPLGGVMVGTGNGSAHPACYYRKAYDLHDAAITELKRRFSVMECLLELADSALRDTGHEPKCQAVNMQLHCTCGSSETFKPKRAEFYKQYTEWKRMTR